MCKEAIVEAAKFVSREISNMPTDREDKSRTPVSQCLEVVEISRRKPYRRIPKIDRARLRLYDL
jgi:hypothetical protein